MNLFLYLYGNGGDNFSSSMTVGTYMHVTTVLAPTCHLELWKSIFKCQIVFQVVLFLELPLNLKYFGVCPEKIDLCVLIGHHHIIISHLLLWYDLFYLLYFRRNIITSI